MNLLPHHACRPRLPRAVALLAVAALAVLSACEERDIILPGKREGLRDVLIDAEAPALVENRALAISLPPQRRNADWAQFWGTAAFRTPHPAFSTSPTLAWSADIGAGDSRRQRITADPVVGGGRIFTLDAGATVTAVSPAGQRLWSRDLTPDGDRDQASGGGLAYDGGRLYVTLGYGTLAVLDAADGRTLWTQDLEATGSGAPTVSGGLVYLTSGDNTAWAIDAATGRIRWQIGGTESVSNIASAPAPVVTDDLVIFGFGSGDLRALFKRGGLQRWGALVVGERIGYALSEIGDITAPPVVDGNLVFAGNQSGRVMALNLGNGDTVWTALEGASGPIWPAGGSLFFVSDRNELLRISARDGSRIWGTELPLYTKDRPRKRGEVFAHYGPVLAGGRLVVVSNDGRMRSFDPVSGALIGAVDIPGGASTGPVIADGTLYVVNTKGQLLAYR